jgi:hypothetical protein
MRYLGSSGFLFVYVALMYYEMVGKHVKGHPRDVHLEEASGLVPAVPYKPFIAPGYIVSKRSIHDHTANFTKELRPS